MRKILAFLFLCLLLMHSHTAKSQPDCQISFKEIDFLYALMEKSDHIRL